MEKFGLKLIRLAKEKRGYSPPPPPPPDNNPKRPHHEWRLDLGRRLKIFIFQSQYLIRTLKNAEEQNDNNNKTQTHPTLGLV